MNLRFLLLLYLKQVPEVDRELFAFQLRELESDMRYKTLVQRVNLGEIPQLSVLGTNFRERSSLKLTLSADDLVKMRSCDVLCVCAVHNISVHPKIVYFLLTFYMHTFLQLHL